ncbi:MAG: FAD/NAD(P)-binding protein [Myxococcaceae bacterium]|nr:FAD/NAD(P)-binding protein [Myxococcaceae bacterium]
MFDVVIIGGGAGGTLLAVQLLRRARASLRLAWVDRAGAFGRGVAYGTADPCHLLNVSVARMSALPEDPTHFLGWLEQHSIAAGPGDFLPRGLYGRYLLELLSEAERRAGVRGALHRIHDEAVALAVDEEGVGVRLAGGRRIRARRAVLALGNAAPADLSVPDGGLFASTRFVRSPWKLGALHGVAGPHPVLLVGTGLTAVDVVLSLRERRHRGPIHALSRHGFLPQAHAFSHPQAPPLPTRPGPLSVRTLLRTFRARLVEAEARGASWRGLMDALRPWTPSLWKALSPVERRRFLRHLRPWWDCHRHRMAPQVAAAVEALQHEQLLRVHAGRLVRFALQEAGVEAVFRPRGRPDLRTLEVAYVVNCTGPASDVGPGATPLVRDLLARGLARPDVTGLGLDTAEGALVDSSGWRSRHLFALGPVRRGELWETTSVPELREQAAALAEQLLHDMAEAGALAPGGT